MVELAAPSHKWGYIRIITGTILGGVLGFYVMHRMELSYKEKMKERLRNYELELKRREAQASSLEEELKDPSLLKGREAARPVSNDVPIRWKLRLVNHHCRSQHEAFLSDYKQAHLQNRATYIHRVVSDVCDLVS